MQVWPTGALFGLAPKRLRAVLIATTTVIGIAGLLYGVVLIENLRIARDAQAALTDVQRLEVGSSTIADMQKFAEKFSRHRAHGLDCGKRTCAVFQFYNPLMMRMQLPKTTYFTIALEGQDRLDWMELSMVNNRGSSVHVVSRTDGQRGNFMAGGKVPVGAVRPVLSIFVRFSPEATATQKTAALSFNMDCVRSLRGCGFADEMLPQVTQLSEWNHVAARHD
jgi:hypothetical protein